jgi:capsular exopolysaccharide synthesis family protein
MMKHFLVIVVCTFIGFVSFFVVNRYITDPSYTAQVKLYVNPNEATGTGDLNELNYAQKVISTYINFLRTNQFYKEVMKGSGLNYTANDLRGMTTIQSIDNTEIFEISVTSNDPEHSYILVKTMQELAPDFIRNIKDTSEINIVDPVSLPESPSGPNILFNTLVGGILGLLFSSIASFVWEAFNIKIKNKDELVRRYSIPVLGNIPYYKNTDKGLFDFIPFMRNRALPIQQKVVGTEEDKRFDVNEAFQELRTNMRFTLFNTGCKKLIITSPLPEEGKSTTSSNLAIKLAQAGERVLLLDCDLRKGKIGSYFNLRSRPGISDVLSGLLNEKDVIQNTNYENLKIITMGSIPPNPAELISSTQMEEFIQRVEKDYDYIIIDSPPVNVVSDVLGIAKLVDGVAIVVREGVTSHPNVTNALEKFKLTDAVVLGFIINGTSQNQVKRSKSYYYYQSNHG